MMVTAEDVQNRISRGEPVLLLDAARPDGWLVVGKGTEGVRRLRPEEVSGLTRSMPRDHHVVTYASNSADEQPATLLANLLKQQGYSRVDTLAGGSEGWRRLGLAARADAAGIRFPSVW